jgi:hypothetical protein
VNWFRLYAEFATDPKVQMMSEAMQRRLIMLFCVQCGNGVETFHVTERETSLAFALRVSPEEMAATKAEFLRRGFINDDWTLRNWNKRQYASDSSTARVRKHREGLKRQEPEEGNEEKRFSNALEQNRTDTEEELPNGNSRASAVAAAPAKSDPIPYQAVVDLFNATMVGLSKVRDLTPKRRTLIRAAWQASPKRRTRTFWTAFFAECQDDAFLNGTGPYSADHPNWRPTFDYLLRADVVTRVFERAMDRVEREQEAAA